MLHKHAAADSATVQRLPAASPGLTCHSDDVESRCGGAVFRLAEERSGCVLRWVGLSAAGIREGIREGEAKKSATHYLKPRRLSQIVLKAFNAPSGYAKAFCGRKRLW